MSTIMTQKENPHIKTPRRNAEEKVKKRSSEMTKNMPIFFPCDSTEQIEIQRDLTHTAELRYSTEHGDNIGERERYEVEVSTLILGLNLLNFGDKIIFFRWSEL